MAGTGLTVYRGDSKSLRVDVGVPDGYQYSLSDLRLVMTVKDDPESSEVLLQKVARLVGSTFVIDLTPEETDLDPAQYRYDLELSNESRSYVKTLLVGVFTVQLDITRKVF